MRIRHLSLLLCLAGAAFAQSTEAKLSTELKLPSFEIADVHPSPHSSNMNRYMSGPTVRAGRYIVRTASMLDLVSTAYNMDPMRVYGGPNWLEMERFDIVAKVAPGTNHNSQNLMLRSLLAERFSLVVHEDSRPMAAYALTSAKRPQMKPAENSDEPGGCKFEFKPAPKPSADGSPAQLPQLNYTCHNMTMAAFADGMRDMAVIPDVLNNRPVVDQTEIQGAWDFNFTFPLPRRMTGGTGPAEDTTLFEAMEKQLGLKLEAIKKPLPVLVVDVVNQKPTANSPEVSAALAGSTQPTEFDAAAIKPTDPEFKGISLNIDKSGVVNIRGATLKFLIQQIVYNVTDEMMAAVPKWMNDGERWDIIAKPPSAALTIGGAENSAPIDFETVTVMLKSLLAERFKLATHFEERPVPAYTLMTAKPKMRPADPAGRTKCFEGPGPDGKDPREANPILGRLITCQNMSMPQLAELLQGLAPGYIHAPVLDATGLSGNWDFTLSFSPAGAGRTGETATKGGEVATASDPSGALSLLDALPKQLGLKLEMQKRAVQVLVIDHVEQKPTDN